MPDHLVRKLELRDHLLEEEKEILRRLADHPEEIAANTELVREGDQPTESILLLEGFTCRFLMLRGGERQITSLHIPGDFIDLPGFLVKEMDHGILTLTACTVARVAHAELVRITEEWPHLARLLWLMTLIDAAINRRWIAAIGRQSALSHTAHLLCEMYLLQKGVLLNSEGSFRMPLSQVMLADALGLSPVHTNRVIRELREGNYVDWRGQQVMIKDWNRLVDLGEFDPTYLSLTKEPR